MIDDGNCAYNERKREVALTLCSLDKQEEIKEYLGRTKGELNQSRFGDKALCADMDDFYITGEPDTYSEASLIIDFQYNPEIDQDLAEQEEPSFLNKTAVYVKFDQINMKEGTFS